jgi:purine-nucleoside phosphorylase
LGPQHCYEQIEEAADALGAGLTGVPEVGVVLGSGLDHFVEVLQPAVSRAYEELPHWPASRVPGHAGRAVMGALRGRRVVALAGRCHAYEGHSLAAVTFATRVLGRLGVRVLVLTNAAGGINAGFRPGSLMLIDDHLNLMGANPLAGPHDDRFGPRFPDMSQVYSARLRTLAHDVARASGIPLVHGVYAAVIGPSYETPAEIRYLRRMGADAVGMSTVPEAIVARQIGIEVLGISCITNMAAGMLPQTLDHTDVLETAHRTGGAFSALMEGIIGRL